MFSLFQPSLQPLFIPPPPPPLVPTLHVLTGNQIDSNLQKKKKKKRRKKRKKKKKINLCILSSHSLTSLRCGQEQKIILYK